MSTDALAAYADQSVTALPLDIAEFDASEDIGVLISAKVVENKDELIGQPLRIYSITYRTSEEYGGSYVSLEAFTEDGERVVINDGGTGIPAQVARFLMAKDFSVELDKPFPVRMVARNGLRRSDYPAKGEAPYTGPGERPAGTTYYLA